MTAATASTTMADGTPSPELLSGLRVWLDHFGAARWRAADGDWQCAHPRSLQTRALTCASSNGTANARHVMQDDSTRSACVPLVLYRVLIACHAHYTAEDL